MRRILICLLVVCMPFVSQAQIGGLGDPQPVDTDPCLNVGAQVTDPNTGLPIDCPVSTVPEPGPAGLLILGGLVFLVSRGWRNRK